MFVLNLVAKIIGILHSDKDPRHLALGFALGSIIGLSPSFTLQNLFVFCLIFLLNVSISAALLAVAVFGLFAYLLDPVFHAAGYYLLVSVAFLKPFWTWLYNAPIAPLPKFYNTVTLGSFVCSLVFFYPAYLGFKKVVAFYRRRLAKRIESLRIIQFFKASSFVQWYDKIRALGV